MEKSDCRKRAEDLKARCERNSCLTQTGFLTPAEQFELKDLGAVFFGGGADCERQAAFFLPYYMQEESLNRAELICALRIHAYFGVPEHRDYMGAILGMGIKREWIGDIAVHGDTAYVFCLPSVRDTLLRDLTQVGRISVKVSAVPLSEVPAKERNVRRITFTVKSLRLDAVTGDLFGLSRTSAAEAIRQGLVSLNYQICEKTDASVKVNDILSLRGKGKAILTEAGGKSRKDRLFITAEVYL